MKKILILSLILMISLMRVLSQAAQIESVRKLYCIGGIDYNRYNLSRQLNEVDEAQLPTWFNESEFDGRNFSFKVEALEKRYHYQIILKDQNQILIDEDVKSLPQLKSVPLNKDENVFIHCREMSPADFCRYYTC